MLFRYREGLALVLALARPMVVLAEELVALAVDPLLLAVRLPARKSTSECGCRVRAAKFDSRAAVCSVPKLVPGLTWCACLFERHQASSSCVAMAARWCAARVRAFRRRRSRSSAAPRRRAADAVVATIVATRRRARARRISAALLGAARSVDCSSARAAP